MSSPPRTPPPPPPRRAPGPRASREGGRGLHPLLVALAAAALAVLFVCGVGVVALLLRGSHRANAQQVVGAAIPAGWLPGRGGAGPVPPLPAAGPQAPLGAPAPLPSVVPAQPEEPPPDTGASPPPEQAPPPGMPPSAPVAPPPADSFEPPRLIDLPTPEYPVVGQRMGVEGTVVLQVLVAADGHVLEANPVGERLGMGFEAAARRAAFAARFEPARRAGQPVEGETRIAIRFRLR